MGFIQPNAQPRSGQTDPRCSKKGAKGATFTPKTNSLQYISKFHALLFAPLRVDGLKLAVFNEISEKPNFFPFERRIRRGKV